MSKKFFAAALLSVAILSSGCGDDAKVDDSTKAAPTKAVQSAEPATAEAMSLTIDDKIGHIGQTGKAELDITGYAQLEGDTAKGVALFGKNLYFHFDTPLLQEKMPHANTQDERQAIFDEASRFGGSDIANTVPVFVFEGGTNICPVTSDDGREFYLLKTETGGGGCATLIGEQDGKWVKYFEEMYLATGKKLGGNYFLNKIYTDGDAIAFDYEQSDTKKICSVIYRWNEETQSFDVEIVQ